MRNLLKNLGIISLFFVLYSCATTSSEPAMVETEGSETAQEQVEEKEAQWVTVEVDEYFVSQETISYEDGFIDGYRLYEYDESGKLLKKSQVGSDENIISEELFTYNMDGLLVKSEFFSGGKAVSYSEFTYNSNMMLIEEEYFNPKGDLLAVSSYEYDDMNRRSKWVSGDSGGIPMMYTEYEYKSEDLVQLNYHMPSGEVEGYSQMEYKDGVMLREATYSANSKLEKKTEYTLVDGQAQKAEYYMGNNLIRTVEYTRDSNGNIIEEKTMNRHGDVIDIISKEYVVYTVEKTVLQ